MKVLDGFRGSFVNDWKLKENGESGSTRSVVKVRGDVECVGDLCCGVIHEV